MTTGPDDGLAGLPHHDGSDRFVVRADGEAESPVVVFLVEPPGRPAASAAVRYLRHGEVAYRPGQVDRVDGEGRWWRFELPSAGLSYRFLWQAPDGGHLHLNGEGVHPVEPTDAADFRLRRSPPAPRWARQAVAYYVFLDRFWRAGGDPTGGTVSPLARWTDPVADDYPANVQQFYGGDLDGVRARLGEIERLGAGLLILSPFFPAPESHRYCASSFDRVDPLLGGDEALQRLVDAAHDRGIRCVGDLTLNHCGSTHEWFRGAVASPTSDDAQLFSFVDHPDDYLTYQGVSTLPKLNYGNHETRVRMYAGAEAPVRRWLRSPYGLDGWRFDVAAMVGRQGSIDVNREVARGVRDAMAAARAETFHVAEILHDPAADLVDERWVGSLLDAGFQSPVRAFCSSPAPHRPGARPSGRQLHQSLRRFAAAVPWDALVSSVGFVGSHDLPRLRSETGSRDAALLAHFLLLTFPSIPMLYAGDELGVEGTSADLGRAPMPWPETGLPRDTAMLDAVRVLVQLRGASHGLVHGGFRWLAATDDLLAYERCSRRERVVCVASRRRGRESFALPTSGEPEALLTHGASLEVVGRQATCELSVDNGHGIWVLR